MTLSIDRYKQAIADSYDRRSCNYDEGQWRQQVCDRLLDHSQVKTGYSVLDIGTGTGYLAIAAARIVGSEGHVVGVDLSPEMLLKARRKAEAAPDLNLQFLLADAEALDYPDASFDEVLCANTFPWLSDKAAALKTWHRFLKPGGQIAVHTPADKAYIGPVVLRQVLASHGIDVEPSNRLGSIELCQELFEAAGFSNIKIHQEQHGSYTSFENAYGYWQSIVESPSPLSLKVSENLAQCSTVQLAKIKSDFEAALVQRQTEQGIWDGLDTLYIIGQKPGICIQLKT